jgi:hypothetical protein
MLALAIGLLAIAVTLVIAGTISSSQASSTVQVAQPAAAKPGVQVSSNIGFDPGMTSVARRDISAGQSWDPGVGYDPGFVSAKMVRQEWGLGVGFEAGHVAATASGLDTVRQLPGLGIGFDPGFVSRQAAPQVHGLETGLTEH